MPGPPAPTLAGRGDARGLPSPSPAPDYASSRSYSTAMSGASECTTEQYLSSERSMARRALPSSRPVPRSWKVKRIERNRLGASARRTPATPIRSELRPTCIFSRIDTTSDPEQAAAARSSVSIGPGASALSPSTSVAGPPVSPPRKRMPPSQVTVTCFVSPVIFSPLNCEPQRHRETPRDCFSVAPCLCGLQFRAACGSIGLKWPLLAAGHPAVIPDRIQAHRGGGPRYRTQQRRSGEKRHQGEQLAQGYRLTPQASRDGTRATRDGGYPERDRGHDVAQQHSRDLVPLEAPGEDHHAERACHEELVGDGIEHRPEGGGPVPPGDRAVEEIRDGREGDDREPRPHVVDQQKPDREREPHRREDVRGGPPRRGAISCPVGDAGRWIGVGNAHRPNIPRPAGMIPASGSLRFRARFPPPW